MNPDALIIDVVTEVVRKGLGNGKPLSKNYFDLLSPYATPAKVFSNGSAIGGKPMHKIKQMPGEKPEAAPADPNQRDPQPDAAGQGSPLPIGAQYLAGIHDYCMKAAEFAKANIGALEPELAGTFGDIDKSVAQCMKALATKFSERYPELPPLAGGDWEDPDSMTEGAEMDPTNDTVPDGEVPNDMDSADDEAVKATIDPDDSTEPVEEGEDTFVQDPEDQESDESDIPGKPKKSKKSANVYRAKLFALLDRHEAIQFERKKIYVPGAADAANDTIELLEEAVQVRTIEPSLRRRFRNQAAKLKTWVPTMRKEYTGKVTLDQPQVDPAVAEAIERLANLANNVNKRIEKVV